MTELLTILLSFYIGGFTYVSIALVRQGEEAMEALQTAAVWPYLLTLD